ncbi:MAG: DUF4160 domain-containing protein [Alphaproteobacteria bacterium]|nr:MAG: DUF4160 domain-containing protein [Alphaproteobacteria bacterium]
MNARACASATAPRSNPLFANEGRPREPVHIHVERGEQQAKFWLRPEISIAYNDGFSARTLRELLRLVEANRERIEKAWSDFFR